MSQGNSSSVGYHTVSATNKLSSPIGLNLANNVTRTLAPSSGAIAYDAGVEVLYFGTVDQWRIIGSTGLGSTGQKGDQGSTGQPGMASSTGMTGSVGLGSTGQTGLGTTGSTGQQGNNGIGSTGSTGLNAVTQVNGVTLISPSPVNLINSTGIIVTNTSAGNITFSADPFTSVTAVNANGGTNEHGVITLKDGNQIGITDSPAGTFNFNLADPLLLPGNERITTYLGIGSLAVPTNTSPGDLSLVRLSVNQTLAFSGSTGEYVIINGNMPDTSGTAYGLVSALTTTPTGTSTAKLVGNLISISTDTSGNSWTGSVIGSQLTAIHQGSADVVNLIGSLANTQTSGNLFGFNGLRIVNINNGGTGYTLNDVLTVTTGSGTATVIASSVSAGVITAITIQHPGSGYAISANVPATGGTGTGATINIVSVSSGTISNAVGLQVQPFTALGQFTTGVITSANGIQVIDSNRGSGPDPLPTQIGINVLTLTQGTSTNVGVKISGPTTGSSNNFGLQFVTGVNTAPTTANAGITWGTDVNLYRSAANTLKTDTNFTTPLDVTARHFISNSAIPTATAGTGAGTGPTVTVTALSTDTGQQITVLTGTAPTASGNIFTLTFATNFPNAVNSVVFSAANGAAAALNGTQHPFIFSSATSNYVFRAGSVALAATTTYIWNFSVRAS